MTKEIFSSFYEILWIVVGPSKHRITLMAKDSADDFCLMDMIRVPSMFCTRFIVLTYRTDLTLRIKYPFPLFAVYSVVSFYSKPA